MEALDLFKDFSPRELEVLISLGNEQRGGDRWKDASLEDRKAWRGKIREASNNMWNSRSDEEKRKLLEGSFHSRESRKKAAMGIARQIASLTPELQQERLRNSMHSEAAKEQTRQRLRTQWDCYTPEQKVERLVKGFHNPEARRRAKISLDKVFSSQEYSRVLSEAQSKRWVSMSPREKLDFGLKVSDGMKTYWAQFTPIERSEITRKAFNSPESINSRRRYLDSLGPVGRRKWMDQSCRSPEGILKAASKLKSRPTQLEDQVGRYSERRNPGKWIYNGDGSQKVTVGQRIPDFIRADGTKEAISAMGGLGFVHFLDDEEEEIEYYKRHGWRCLVIWEWDAYNPAELDRILGEFK